MGKTFGELSIGDKVYMCVILESSAVIKTGNCEKAYKLLGDTFTIKKYPILGIKEYRICGIIEKNNNYIIIAVKENENYIRHFGPVSKQNTIYFCNAIYSKSIFSVSKKEVIEKSKEIISAFIAAEKNNAQIRIKMFHDMFSKLNKYEKEEL